MSIGMNLPKQKSKNGDIKVVYVRFPTVDMKKITLYPGLKELEHRQIEKAKEKEKHEQENIKSYLRENSDQIEWYKIMNTRKIKVKNSLAKKCLEFMIQIEKHN